MSIDPNTLNQTLAKAVSELEPSLARVHTWGGPATAIAVSEDQLVTVHRAVARRDETPLTLPDGNTVTAKVIGRDPTTDLALLQVEGVTLTPARWADPELAPGHLVLIAGRPSKGVKVTWGLVSDVGEAWSSPRGGLLDRFIEVDGQLPDGFAGGPLVSVNGEVIGLNSRALTRTGTTIASSTVQRVVERLRSGRPLRQGYLGVGVQPVELPPYMTEGESPVRGVLVVHLQPEGPAWQAGVYLGDVLLSIGSHALTEPVSLKAALGDDVVDTEVTVTLLRGGSRIELTATVAERPARQHRGHPGWHHHGHDHHHHGPGHDRGRDRDRRRRFAWFQTR